MSIFKIKLNYICDDFSDIVLFLQKTKATYVFNPEEQEFVIRDADIDSLKNFCLKYKLNYEEV